MTNRKLINVVRPTLEALSGGNPDIEYDGVQTTTVRYAIIKNERRIQDSLEDYQEALNELTEEHGVESFEDDLPEDFEEELEELLDQESGFEPYNITEDDLKAEPNIPFELIAAADEWLVE